MRPMRSLDLKGVQCHSQVRHAGMLGVDRSDKLRNGDLIEEILSSGADLEGTEDILTFSTAYLAFSKKV